MVIYSDIMMIAGMLRFYVIYFLNLMLFVYTCHVFIYTAEYQAVNVLVLFLSVDIVFIVLNEYSPGIP